MPADPAEGDAFRPENAFPIVFEEVTVQAVDQTYDGPRGPVEGAILIQELHMEGTFEDKVFAPSYGEFSTGAFGDLEALALAVPTDALGGPPPAELDVMTTRAMDIVDAASAANWDEAAADLAALGEAWVALRGAGPIPPLLDAQMTRALATLEGDALAPAVDAHDRDGSRKAAIDVAMAALDLQLRHRPVADVDLDRFGLWTEQLLVDTANENEPGAIAGDVTVLEWIGDRFAHTLDPADLTAVDDLVDELRTAAEDEDFAAATDTGERLQSLVTDLTTA